MPAGARSSLRPCLHEGNATTQDSGGTRREIANSRPLFGSYIGAKTSHSTLAVVARLDRATQYSETMVIEKRGRGVLDAQSSRGMTAWRYRISSKAEDWNGENSPRLAVTAEEIRFLDEP